MRGAAPVGVLQVAVAALGQDESEYLLLVEDGSEVVSVLPPRHVAEVVGLQRDVDLLVEKVVHPVNLLIIAAEEVPIAASVKV